jgi:hypothetical protein
MSGALKFLGSPIGTAATIVGGLAVTALLAGPGAIGDVYLKPFRAIGNVIPNVVIEEVGHDELELPQHPVEASAPITDHAYKRPVELTIRAGWSNSGNRPGYVKEMYFHLLSLQASLTPMIVYTGKRTYINMMMHSLQVVNNESTEWALMVQFGLREIIIVSTQSAQAPQTEPQKTAAPVNAGATQAQPTTPGAKSSIDINAKTFVPTLAT